MAGTFLVNGSNVSIIFTYTSTIATIQSLISAAAQSYWNQGIGVVYQADGITPIPFANLTNQQQLDIVDAYIKWTVMREAYQQLSRVAAAAAVAGVVAPTI